MMTVREHRELKNTIKKMVCEALEYENYSFEGDQKKNNDSDSDEKSSKRSIVLRWLNDPELNCAEIMRQLWHPGDEEEDSKRSYFYKCRDGELNDAGEPYSFTDEDITSLYKIKSGSK